MKIENRLSTLTNKIKENLSLLGDGCSLLTLVNNENYYKPWERNSTSGVGSRVNNDAF
jgi:hypothetical protein